MKTIKKQNIIQPKTTKTKKKKRKRSKMLRYINKKGPRLSKLRKVFAPGPPDIETITGCRVLNRGACLPKAPECEIKKTVFNMNMCFFYTKSKPSYFVMRVCGPRLQQFFSMWPAVQKVCPPLL